MTLARRKEPVNKKDGEEVAANHLGRKVKPADLISVKIHGDSWWPAQVVDENIVSEAIKPGFKSAGEVLVRLYGSHTCLYVDPIKCHSEFSAVLKENNNCYREIFMKTLEQDLARLKAGKSKRQGSKSKEVKIGNSLSTKAKEGSNGAPERATRNSFSASGSNAQEEERSKSAEHGKLHEKRILIDLTAVETPRKKKSKNEMKSGDLLSPKAKEASNEAPKRVTRSSFNARFSNALEKGRSKSSKHGKPHEKHIIIDLTAEEKSRKKKTSNGKLQRNAYQESPKVTKEESKAFKQNGTVKKSKQNSIDAKEESIQTPRQNGLQIKHKSKDQVVKEGGKRKSAKQDNSNSEVTPFTKSELSARRLRVMQILGLTAPPGSPFCKNGQNI
ncbi:hypothetical protein UlMin_034712 [Ulmus minor]